MSKTQIDKIGDKLRAGDVDADALEELESYRDEFVPAYAEVEHILRDTLGYQVTGRPAKSTIAIVEKLKRQKTRLTQIQDIAGCRIIVGSITDQESLIDAATVMLGDVYVDDKREAPTNGYRAVHLIVRRKKKLIEVQVRTRLQHLWAEISEKLADTYGQDIKYGRGDLFALNFLELLSVRVKRIEDLQVRRTIALRASTQSAKSMRETRKSIKLIETQVRHEIYRINSLFNSLGEHGI